MHWDQAERGMSKPVGEERWVETEYPVQSPLDLNLILTSHPCQSERSPVNPELSGTDKIATRRWLMSRIHDEEDLSTSGWGEIDLG